MATAENNIIKLKGVRLSFPDLFEAKQYQGQGPFNYSATFLFPAGHPQIQVIEAEIKRAAQEKWNKDAAKNLAAIRGNSQKCCWIDGNTKSYDGYAGHWALSAKRGQDRGRPVVIDTDKSPLTQADGRPYAGCWVNASVEVYCQDNSFGKGIRCTLRGVQFLRDGETFSAAVPLSEDEFDTETAEDLV
jgi:hypothetical protein